MNLVNPVHLPWTPAQAWSAWPQDIPLIGLCSHSAPGWGAGGGGRWSILARPSEATERVPNQVLTSRPREDRGGGQPPFAGGWIGWLAYEQGSAWEPAAKGRGSPGRTSDSFPAPVSRWYRCDDALMFDHGAGTWWAGGKPPIEAMTRRLAGASETPRAFSAGPLRSAMGRLAYEDAVRRGIGYIRAGDVYQVNLAHELTGTFEGSSRAAFAAMSLAAAPAMGAYFEAGERGGGRSAILSASPEMFLDYSPRTGRVSTRPMKGTRPGGGSEAELRAASKDRAELNMIIDLMRNDLGRVCELGSVRVDEPRSIERHGGASSDAAVLQATGTVSGQLRAGASVEDLLRATFPGGSVTGAPKIRAMQIIEELEPSPRGVYCGAIGFVSDSGEAQFSIAIRTAVIHGKAAPGGLDRFAKRARLSYRVGAGIVAESEPGAEWEETLVKARAVRALGRVADDAPPARGEESA